jgi:CheY-like chemotaxis protein
MHMTETNKAGLQILVADNDEISRKILKHFLKPYAEIKEAADGDETLVEYYRAFDSGTPLDLIFLDNVMPGKQGFEVLEAIREHEKQHPDKVKKPVSVIMVTGTASPQQVDKLQRLGIDYYLLKPFEERKLMREMQRLGFIKDPKDSWD